VSAASGLPRGIVSTACREVAPVITTATVHVAEGACCSSGNKSHSKKRLSQIVPRDVVRSDLPGKASCCDEIRLRQRIPVGPLGTARTRRAGTGDEGGGRQFISGRSETTGCGRRTEDRVKNRCRWVGSAGRGATRTGREAFCGRPAAFGMVPAWSRQGRVTSRIEKSSSRMSAPFNSRQCLISRSMMCWPGTSPCERNDTNSSWVHSPPSRLWISNAPSL